MCHQSSRGESCSIVSFPWLQSCRVSVVRENLVSGSDPDEILKVVEVGEPVSIPLDLPPIKEVFYTPFLITQQV